MADNINSGKIIQEPTTTIDPRFFVPPGVIDVRERTADESAQIYDVDTTVVSGEDVQPPAPDSINDGTRLATPSSITVVTPQTVRFAPDGTQVVDVILEIADVEGATNYDVRVTKA